MVSSSFSSFIYKFSFLITDVPTFPDTKQITMKLYFWKRQGKATREAHSDTSIGKFFFRNLHKKGWMEEETIKVSLCGYNINNVPQTEIEFRGLPEMCRSKVAD